MPRHFEYLLWLDFEANDLVYDADITEAAVILTGRDRPFEEVARHEAVLRPQDGWEDRGNPIAMQMMRASGLYDLLPGEWPLYTWESEVIEMLRAVGRPGDFLLAGSGIGHYDRQLVKLQLPRLEAWLHYPNFDVGCWRRGVVMAGREDLLAALPEERKVHRAMADIEDHLAEWRAYAEWVQALPRRP